MVVDYDTLPGCADMMVRMTCWLGNPGSLPSLGRDRVAEGSAPECPSHLPHGPSCGDPLTASTRK